MSVFLLVDTETPLIDSYRPQVDFTAPSVTQADNPGEDLQMIGGDKGYILPDPSIGGQNASRNRNGFSTGFKSFFTRTQRFTGAVAKPPAIENPVQGQVGMSRRAGRLYAGVMNQLVQYDVSPAAYASAYVGVLPHNVIVQDN